MTRVRFTGATLLALTLSTGAVSAQSQFSAERMKAHVTFLADDLLEGREAGTRGHEIAAKYLATQLEMLGLRPGGENGTWYQTVELLEAALNEENTRLTLTTPSGATVYKHKDKVMLRPPMALAGALPPNSSIVAGRTGGTVASGAPAPGAGLVFVGFGMKDAALGYDDYADLDVRGKVVVVLWDSPKGIDSELGAHLRSQQSKVAADHGAVGVIAVQTRVTAAAVPWVVVQRLYDEPTTTWMQKDGTPFDPGYGLQFGALMEQTAASSLFEQSTRTLAQILDEVEQPGTRPKGFALKASASLDSVSATYRRFSSPEVIGVLDGSDARLKSEYVALMGHIDHIGLSKAGADRINNGALDNAAGAATLIEVARALATAAQRPRRSVLIVANTAEEKGLLGAEHFAHYPTVPIEKITAAIDLDMPMLLYDFTDAVAYGSTHSTLDSVFRKAGAAMGVKMSPDPMPEQAVFVRSDHYAMVKAGVPAVMLATGMANGGEAAWGKFLSNTYHQPSDDLSQPILWQAGAKFAELNYRVVRELADADQPARWYANDYFGDLFAPKASKVPKPAAAR